ncbi:MAG: MFS transporter [Proteobacteria bacterium]|nr:MFS transporter [Pseudomonadota bacterium]
MAEAPPAASVARLASYPWLVVAVTCVGAFLGQLDASIVQLALPAIGLRFHAALDAVTWVSLGYLVAFAACLPMFGRLCEMFGRKSLYLIGYALFTLGSLMCGFAPDLPSLIAARVVQGVGGSMLGANSVSILVKSVGREQQGRAMGIFAAAQAVGVSAGPAVGGLVLAVLDWRWVFWIAVPFGVAAVLAGWAILPQTRDVAPGQRFDRTGALLLTPALVLLVLGLNEGAAWPALRTLGCVAGFLALGALFVAHERRTRAPLVALGLFASGPFALGSAGTVLGYGLLYGMFFLMSFALVHGYGEPADLAGLRLAAIPVALGLAAPFSGGLSDRVGAGRLGAFGMVLCAAALLVLALTADARVLGGPAGVAAFALFGIGLGVYLAPTNHATVSAAPPALSGQAGATLNLMRVLGTSLGVASASSMLGWRLSAGTGGQGTWLDFPGHPMLTAVESSLAMLLAFAAIAALMAMMRPRHGAPAAT